MRKFYLISLLLLTCFVFGQKNHGIIKMSYRYGITEDSIRMPGDSFLFKQFCSKAIDSVVSNGNVSFDKSKVGKVDTCRYEFQIRKDSLAATIIETESKITTEQLIEQTSLQFGEPTRSIIGEDVFYKWEKNTLKKCLRANLSTKKDYNKAKLIIYDQKILKDAP